MQNRKRIALLLLCTMAGLTAYVALDYWNSRNAPLFKILERQWQQDVEALEASGKLPKPWFAIKELEIYGGTPETKAWLKRINHPLKTNPSGTHKLEVLLVVWEEDRKNGVLVQYNLVDLKSQNMVWELGRTLILKDPTAKNPVEELLEDLRQ